MNEISEVERWLAVQEIQELQARRCYAVDNKDWEAFENLHAPDHVSNHSFARWTTAREATATISASLVGKTSMHHLHTPIITLDSATTASGIWAMEDHIWWEEDQQAKWYHGYGFYYETYGKRDGRWVFTSRRLQRTREESSE